MLVLMCIAHFEPITRAEFVVFHRQGDQPRFYWSSARSEADCVRSALPDVGAGDADDQLCLIISELR
ncbi:hypothetical protein X739_08685 [Mesorhizobium sp. LNHC220B00]|nr:hypothetical protein X739_08685 [Mesorhizobium sp. LNHC220B00]